MKKVLTAALLLLFSIHFAFSQDAKKLWFSEIGFLHSNMIPNSTQYKDLWKDCQGYGFDAKFGVQTLGNTQIEQLHNYPKFGMGIRYYKFSYNVLQSSAAAYGFINAPIYRGERFSFNYQAGLGLAYFSNPFDSVTNPNNDFIGSYINCYIDLELNLDYKLTNNLDLFAAAQFTHSSNGALQRPNLGMNNFSQEIGLRYYFDKNPRPEFIHKTYEAFTPKDFWYVCVSPSLREAYDDNRYFVLNLEASFERQFSPLFTWGAGLDLSYNSSTPAYYEDGVSQGTSYKQIMQWYPAAFGSFEVLYGRVGIHVGLALYLRPIPDWDYHTPYYERAGFRVYLTENHSQFAGVSVRAHGGSVDFIEWTYGIKIL